MMNKVKTALRVGRFALALVVGYAAMVVLITIVQEGIFGGVSYYKSSLFELAGAGFLTTLSAVAGGAIGGFIFGRPWYPPALAMCGLVVAETTYLVLARPLTGPLWFELMAGSSLLVGLLVGAFCAAKARDQRHPKLAAQP